MRCAEFLRKIEKTFGRLINAEGTEGFVPRMAIRARQTFGDFNAGSDGLLFPWLAPRAISSLSCVCVPAHQRRETLENNSIIRHIHMYTRVVWTSHLVNHELCFRIHVLIIVEGQKYLKFMCVDFFVSSSRRWFRSFWQLTDKENIE